MELNMTTTMGYEELFQKRCNEYYSAGLKCGFLAVLLPQLITCFISLCLIVSFSTIFFQKGNYHANAKIIVSLQLCFVSIFCIEYFVAVSKHFLNVLNIQSNRCILVDTTGNCTIFYYSHFISLAGMSFTQMFLSAERVISCRYAKNYESFGKSIGILFSLTAIVASVMISWFSLHGYLPTELRLTCLGSPYTGKSHFLYISLITCDVVSMSLFIYSWCHSRKREEPSGQYFLGRRYQNREIRNLIRMFAPVNIMHFFVYVLYAIGTAVARQYVTEMDPDFVPIYAILVMWVPYYTTFELVILHIVLKRNTGSSDRFKMKLSNQTREDYTDQHFERLAKLWN